MAESSSRSNRSGGGNRSRSNSNRNRGGGNRGGGNRGGRRNSDRGSGGSGGRRFVKQKVPRRTSPPTLWEKFLNLFGLGPKRRPAPPSSAPNGNAAASLREAKSSDRPPRKKAPKKAAAPRQERPAHKPEKVEVTSTRLHVGNLSYDTTDDDLEKLFGDVGPVARAEVVVHNRSQRSKGFAFVEMENLDDAKRAAEHLHDREFMGRPISVGGAKSKRTTPSSDDR